MNPASLVKHYSKVIENIVSELETLEKFKIDNLTGLFVSLKNEFVRLSKLTNNGKVPAELKKTKLQALKKWLQDYSDKENFLLGTVPKKLKNKPVAVDSTTLDTYQEYAQIAIQYIEELPVKYADLKERILPLLKIGERLTKDAENFEMDEGYLFALAQEFAEDIIETQTHNPAKTINSVKAILRVYGRFIEDVEQLQGSLLYNAETIENTLQLDPGYDPESALEQIYRKLNQRNRLVASLVKNLFSLKKLIENNDFSQKLLIVREYQNGLEEVSRHLPFTIFNRLAISKNISPLEQELARSPGKVKEYNPLQDPEMGWPKGKPSKETAKQYTPVYEETQQTPDLPEKTENQLLTPEEKKKYEKLWEEASPYTFSLIRLAKLFEQTESLS